MNILNTVVDYLKRCYHGGRLRPEYDWSVLLALSAIALTGIVVWNEWTFDTVAGGGVVGAVATSSPLTINRASLDEINAIFTNRANEEAKYRTGVYRYADPSQPSQ